MFPIAGIGPVFRELFDSKKALLIALINKIGIKAIRNSMYPYLKSQLKRKKNISILVNKTKK